MITELENKARAFAEKAHRDQRYGDEPYWRHLANVRMVLYDFGFSDLYIAAWLHDTIEDTQVTREEIQQQFGAEVADLVWAVTGVGQNRKERNADAYAKIQKHPRALFLKLADRIANVENATKDRSVVGEPLSASVKAQRADLFEMYKKEWPEFKEKLYGLTGKQFERLMWIRLERALTLKRGTPDWCLAGWGVSLAIAEARGDATAVKRYTELIDFTNAFVYGPGIPAPSKEQIERAEKILEDHKR